MDLGLLAHARGVDELDGKALPLDHRVDGVARGTGDVGDDGALLVGEAVGEARLAHVGTADDGYGEHVVVILGLVVCRVGEGSDDLVEQVPRSVAMARGEGPGLPHAQGVEVPEAVLLVGGVVLLVDDEEDGLVGLAQDAGNLLVLVGDAGRAVDHEHDHVGLLAGKDRLLADARREDVLGLDRLDAASVDEREVPTVPVGVMIGAVARHPARLVNDGVT